MTCSPEYTPVQRIFRILCSNSGECFRGVQKPSCFRPPDAVRRCSASRYRSVFPPVPTEPVSGGPCSGGRPAPAFYPGKTGKTPPYAAEKRYGSEFPPAASHISDDTARPRFGNRGSRSPWKRPRRRKRRSARSRPPSAAAAHKPCFSPLSLAAFRVLLIFSRVSDPDLHGLLTCQLPAAGIRLEQSGVNRPVGYGLPFALLVHDGPGQCVQFYADLPCLPGFQ